MRAAQSIEQVHPTSRHLLAKHLVTVLGTLCAVSALSSGAAAGEEYKQLDGSQIRNQLIGKQLTDRALWGLVYKKNGELIVSNGREMTKHRWWIKGDKLCQDLSNSSDCYEVRRSGGNTQLRGPGETILDGWLRPLSAE
jgi:hypothetical protein